MLCGDSATFQGDERDVIFLSMVVSPGATVAQVQTMYQQRFLTLTLTLTLTLILTRT